MCYICSQDCYIPSPPSVSPFPPPPSSNGPHVSTLLILMLCLVALAFLVLSYLTIRRCRSSLLNSTDHHEIGDLYFFRNSNHDHVWYIRTVGLSQASIDSIPVFDFKKHVNSSDCAVCLGEFLEDEKVRLLPKCGHPFHLPCIDPWLRLHTSCPVCRTPVESAENIQLSGESASEAGVRIEIEESREVVQGVRANTNRSGSHRAISDLAERWAKFRQDSRAGRRTMSLDLSSEFMMLERVEKPSRGGKKSCKNNNSPARFLQKGAVAMKRSLSCSGKRLARKIGSSRSRGSTSEIVEIPRHVE